MLSSVSVEAAVGVKVGFRSSPPPAIKYLTRVGLVAWIGRSTPEPYLGNIRRAAYANRRSIRTPRGDRPPPGSYAKKYRWSRSIARRAPCSYPGPLGKTHMKG